MGLPLTVLAIVGAFAMVIATTNITPAAAQNEEVPRQGSLEAVRGIVDRGLSVVENPEQLLGLLLGEREPMPR
jgi:hypothetical protein